MKKVFLFLIAASLLACETKVNVNREQENVAVAKSMFDAFNRHDWEAMAAVYSDTALFLDPSFGKEYVKKTRAETAAKYKEMETLFPDIHDNVVGMYPSGDKVFVEFVAMGTDPSGGKFSLPIGGVLTFADGKIVKDATYYDNSN